MVKRLTLKEAAQQIEDRELWLWRQKNWKDVGRLSGKGYDYSFDGRNLPGNEGERDFADQDYPGRGLEFEFWDIPN